jgi:hypothetical protein
MYNGSLDPVSSSAFLQKKPRSGLETALPSSREETSLSRAPMQRRPAQQRCTSRPLVLTTRGSGALARADEVLARAGGSSPAKSVSALFHR